MQSNGLIACQSISNGALTSADLPSEIKLLSWGDNPSLKGNIKIGAHTLSALPRNQTAQAFDRIGIDYEHQSVEKHPNFKPAPREYAAYGTPEVRENEGLYLTALTWTPSGKLHARNYCDLSPVVLREAEEVIFLHSVALCPQGAVAGLEFYSADYTLSTSPLRAFVPSCETSSLTPLSTTMNPELSKLLSALFGIEETADEATILTAAQSYMAKETEEPDEPTPLTAMLPNTPSADLQALATSFTALVARVDAAERASILSAALSAGKIVPASAKTLPLEALSAIVSELPADVVPLSSRTPATVQALSANLNATDQAVCAQLGITPDAFTKSI